MVWFRIWIHWLCAFAKLREWLIEIMGTKATDVIIESYGLYGDKRRRIADIAFDLGLTESHARALRG